MHPMIIRKKEKYKVTCPQRTAVGVTVRKEWNAKNKKKNVGKNVGEMKPSGIVRARRSSHKLTAT